MILVLLITTLFCLGLERPDTNQTLMAAYAAIFLAFGTIVLEVFGSERWIIGAAIALFGACIIIGYRKLEIEMTNNRILLEAIFGASLTVFAATLLIFQRAKRSILSFPGIAILLTAALINFGVLYGLPKLI